MRFFTEIPGCAKRLAAAIPAPSLTPSRPRCKVANFAVALSALTVLLVARSVRAEPTAVVHTVDGKTHQWTTITLRDDWAIVGEGETGVVELSAADVLDIDLAPRADVVASKAPAVLFPHGQLLHGTIESSDADAVLFSSPKFQKTSISTLSIEGFLLVTGLSGRAKESAIQQIRDLPRTGDALLLVNGDVLTGTIEQFGPAEWKIAKDGSSRSVPADRLRGAALDPAVIERKSPSGLAATLRLTDGSVIIATKLYSTPEGLEIQSLFGPKMILRMDAVDSISIRGGRVVYLSDIEAIRVETRPFLDDFAPPRMDQSVLGSPLSLGGVLQEKGIGVRGYTRIDYPVEGFVRFQAKIGVDDAASPLASVLFQVLLDDKVVFDSGEMTPADAPRDIDVEIGPAKSLSLVVDFATRGDVGDAADWSAARLIRP